jgi:hypothetical protein
LPEFDAELDVPVVGSGACGWAVALPGGAPSQAQAMTPSRIAGSLLRESPRYPRRRLARSASSTPSIAAW